MDLDLRVLYSSSVVVPCYGLTVDLQKLWRYIPLQTISPKIMTILVISHYNKLLFNLELTTVSASKKD